MTAPTTTLGTRAVRVIAGEDLATDFIRRLRDGTAQPDDLAGLVAPLYGDGLRGFCSALAKALVEVGHA